MIGAIKHTALDVGKLWLMFLTIFVSNLFLLYSAEEEIVTFMLSGFAVEKESAIYLTYEHVGLIILAFLIRFPPSRHVYMLNLFIALSILDMFFFLLYYKSPMLWNPLRSLIFGVPLIYETWSSFKRHLHNS